MKLIDIKNATVSKLTAAVPAVGIVGAEVKQGFKIPAFFIEIIPISKINISKSLYARHVTVEIKYLSKGGTHIENLEMQDTLEETFDLTLQVGDRTIIIEDTDADEIDGALRFRMELQYTDSRIDTDYDNYELMGNLEMKEEI